MAELVKMWKSKNGKYFELLSGAEEEDRVGELLEVFYSLPEAPDGWSFAALARTLAEQGYRITNTNPASA